MLKSRRIGPTAKQHHDIEIPLIPSDGKSLACSVDPSGLDGCTSGAAALRRAIAAETWAAMTSAWRLP
jgi:hypothetical protein